jgi:aryl-alcohol dehydrogenase-like predicted oxidoreductase
MKEGEAGRILNAVLDSGINYIDTSPDYGLSEEYIGKTIAHRREEYYLASKCGCNILSEGKAGDPSHIWNRETLLRNIESSLKLLHTDHLDVWQLHGTMPDDLPSGVNEEVMKTMQELKRDGKVLSIGISFRNGKPNEPLFPAGFAFEAIDEFLSWDVFEVMQIVYGCLTRLNERVIQKASDRGVGMVARGVVRRYSDNYEELFERAGLDSLLDSGETRSGFLIRFALNQPGISTMIIGTKSLDHLQENIQAVSKGALPEEVYRKAADGLASVGIAPDRRV